MRNNSALWLAGSLLTGASALALAVPAAAQTARPRATAQPARAAAAQPAPAPPQQQTIKSITVTGTQRLEPETVRSYTGLRVGQPYARDTLDAALRGLSETELFADFQITDNDGALVIQVRENPVINRVLLEGNKRLKEDKIRPEIRLAPREIYTRSKVRADVARIIELYKRQGRFAATVEPKMVQLDQNRVDIVFEISEGPRSRVRQINIIGNDQFSDGDLKDEMATKEKRLTSFLSSNTTYDPDRLAYDQQKLRQFYLTQGYADFRVVSAVAEQTSDNQDFIITYVVEEGERYKFGDINVESQLRDFTPEDLRRTIPMKSGQWYNAKLVEDTVESLSETAGLLGYAFADVRPKFNRDRDAKTMSITFNVAESPRTYVERIDINGNTITEDKVIRREFRLNEGDAFNSVLLKRSQDRINSLGYFQENLEIDQAEGSAPDRVVLTTNVEEKPTGELSLSAGFSSIENFILQASVRHRNFRGKGQTLSASVNYSSYSKSLELGFTEPYLFDRNISLSGNIYRRDLNSFNFINNNRETTFQQVTTGASVQAGVPLNEYLALLLRYSLNHDDVSLDKRIYYFNGQCDPLLAGRYLCDAVGKRLTSMFGYTLFYDDRDNRLRPSRGQSLAISQDVAGLGGDVRYLRTRINGSKHWRVHGNFIFSTYLEGGLISPWGKKQSSATIDPIRLNDRFQLGEPQMRGFDIRGIGPRVIRYTSVDVSDPTKAIVNEARNTRVDDAIGGRAYYMGRAELEIPLGSGAKEMGIRPSVFADIGSVFSVRRPTLTTLASFRDPADGLYKSICRNSTTGAVTFGTQATPTTGTPTGPYNQCATGSTGIAPFDERFYGDTWKPRLAVGVGFNWKSPFGPFRIDITRALLKQPGDDTKTFSFNVGTQF